MKKFFSFPTNDHPFSSESARDRKKKEEGKKYVSSCKE